MQSLLLQKKIVIHNLVFLGGTSRNRHWSCGTYGNQLDIRLFFREDSKLKNAIGKCKCQKWLLTSVEDDDNLFQNFTDVLHIYDSKDMLLNRYIQMFIVDLIISRYEIM